MDPKTYSDRFINYIIDITDLNTFLKEENDININNDSRISIIN